MKTIRAYNSSGKVITELTQWDSDRCFYIKNHSFEIIPDCHYETDKLCEALVVKGTLTEDDEFVRFDIPNILLCHPDPVRAYIYQAGIEKTSPESKTIYTVKFDMIKRIKPSDYVYTVTEAANYGKLSNRVDELEKKIENSSENNQYGGTVTYEIPKEYYEGEFLAFDRYHTTDPNQTGMNIYIPSIVFKLAKLTLDDARFEEDLSSGLIKEPSEEIFKLPLDEQIPILEEFYKNYMTISQNPWCPKMIKPLLYYALGNIQIIPLQQVFRNPIEAKVVIKREDSEERTIVVANPYITNYDGGGISNLFAPVINVKNDYNEDEKKSTFELSLWILGNCPKYSSDNRYATADDTIEEVTFTFIPDNKYIKADTDTSDTQE